MLRANIAASQRSISRKSNADEIRPSNPHHLHRVDLRDTMLGDASAMDATRFDESNCSSDAGCGCNLVSANEVDSELRSGYVATWQREYEKKLAATDAALARDDLTAIERRRLQRYRNQLADRYHLATSPAVTYKPINVMGYVLKFSVYAFKN